MFFSVIIVHRDIECISMAKMLNKLFAHLPIQPLPCPDDASHLSVSHTRRTLSPKSNDHFALASMTNIAHEKYTGVAFHPASVSITICYETFPNRMMSCLCVCVFVWPHGKLSTACFLCVCVRPIEPLKVLVTGKEFNCFPDHSISHRGKAITTRGVCVARAL